MLQKLRSYLPLAILFLFTLILLVILHPILTSSHIDVQLLHMANAFFLLLFSLSFTIHLSTMNHKNPHVFVRGVMSSMIIKMFATVIAVFIYTTLTGNNFDKKGIFISLCLYLPYLAAEIIATKQKSRKSDA